MEEYPYYDVDMKFEVYNAPEDCLAQLGARAYAPVNSTRLYCNGTFDGVLCWPATPTMTTARQHCPPLPNLLTNMYGKRTCGPLGLWQGKKPGDYTSMPNGWTNYIECYSEEMRDLYEILFGKESSELLKRIASGCKLMEMTGLILSLLSLLLSIFIFCYFRGLRCHRTRIHTNLFLAISIHITIQLIVNIDVMIGQSTGSTVAGATVDHLGMINNTPILCELMQRVLMEYTKTVMFMWMFIEGMYLHNTLVISVFSGRPNYILYYCIGWGVPAVLTLLWAIPTGILDKEECWFGYTFRPLYWLIEGPRALIILINLGFLLNIIRVLVTKLQDSNSNEALKVRKAVKAAIVLLPLLGVNNSLALVEAPMDNAVKFAVFTTVSVFLISFQGFFIALLYCFFNGEVRSTLSRKWERYLIQRGYGDTRNNKRKMDTSSSTPLTYVSAELNAVPLSRKSGSDQGDKTPRNTAHPRRQSDDSGYENEDLLKQGSPVLLLNGHNVAFIPTYGREADTINRNDDVNEKSAVVL